MESTIESDKNITENSLNNLYTDCSTSVYTNETNHASIGTKKSETVDL